LSVEPAPDQPWSGIADADPLLVDHPELTGSALEGR
jgi:hypothetical protein